MTAYSARIVERTVYDERTACLTLRGSFVLAAANDQPVALRFARDAAGRDLVPTALEVGHRERTQKEAAIAEKDAAVAEKETALAEIARLRVELARLQGG